MRAVWYRLRREVASHIMGCLALAVVVGVGGGVVMGSLAAARRTDSAYPRFIKGANAADVQVGVERLNGAEEPFLEAVEHLPQVASTSRRAYLFVTPVDHNHHPLAFGGQPLASADGRWLRDIDRLKIVKGRLPAPGRADELTIGYQAARQYHIHVGYRFQADSYSPASAEKALEGNDVLADGPSLTLTVVGIDVAPGDLAAESTDNVPLHFPYAFFQTYRDKLGWNQAAYVRLRHGGADLAAFRAAAGQLAANEGATMAFVDEQGSTAKAQRAIHLQTVALRLFTALVAVAALLVAAQTITRQLVIDAPDHQTLRALGMSQGSQIGVAIGRVGISTVLGIALGWFLAVGLSPLSPIGLARVAEPHRGTVVDAAVLATGAAAIAAVMLAIAAFPAWLTTRPQSRGSSPAGRAARPSRLADLLARRGLSPSAVTGVRMALESGRGRTAVPVISTLFGAVVAIVALTTSVTFGFSLSHLLATPRLYGSPWDLEAGNPYARDLHDLVVPLLARDPMVVRFAGGSYAPIAVNGHPVSALALRPERSAVDPSLISGRSPEQPDEITLGAKTLHAIHAKVGDTVAVRASDTTRQLRVVGKAVYPANGPSDIGGVGEGAGLTLEGLRTLVPDAPENVFPIVLARGVSRASALAHFNDELGQGQIGVQAPSPSTDVENYRSVRALPLALAGLLVAMALGALIHTLVSSVRRRRRDLAVLKTLGFVRRQVGATVAWQATVLALIALAAGVPLGLATGRWAWTLYAIQQGVIPEVHLPVLIVAAAFPLLIALANVAAALPARSAAATPPAALLRSE